MGININDLAAGSKVLDAWNELIDNKQSAGQGNQRNLNVSSLAREGFTIKSKQFNGESDTINYSNNSVLDLDSAGILSIRVLDNGGK